MALPSATAVLLWLTVAVAFVFFGAIAIGTTWLMVSLGYRVLRDDEA